MRKNGVVWLLLAAGVAAVLGGLTGCDRLMPFKFTVPVELGTYDLGDLVGAAGGTAPSVPICNLPTQDDVDALARAQLGDFVGKLIQVDAMDLTGVKITAEQGDFGFLTSLGLQWVSQPGQAPIDLGTAQAAAGFGSEIVVTPPEPVDFLPFISDGKQSGSSQCGTLKMSFDGTLPDAAQAPVAHGVARVEVIGHVEL